MKRLAISFFLALLFDVLEQIRDDFLQIQVADRKLVKASAASDLKLVTKLTGEIEKRSRRLKGNLALPQPQASPLQTSAKIEEDSPERVRSSLGVLSNLIESFVSNPMFEHSKVLTRRCQITRSGSNHSIERQHQT